MVQFLPKQGNDVLYHIWTVSYLNLLWEVRLNFSDMNLQNFMSYSNSFIGTFYPMLFISELLNYSLNHIRHAMSHNKQLQILYILYVCGIFIWKWVYNRSTNMLPCQIKASLVNLCRIKMHEDISSKVLKKRKKITTDKVEWRRILRYVHKF